MPVHSRIDGRLPLSVHAKIRFRHPLTVFCIFIEAERPADPVASIRGPSMGRRRLWQATQATDLCWPYFVGRIYIRPSTTHVLWRSIQVDGLHDRQDTSDRLCPHRGDAHCGRATCRASFLQMVATPLYYAYDVVLRPAHPWRIRASRNRYRSRRSVPTCTYLLATELHCNTKIGFT